MYLSVLAPFKFCTLGQFSEFRQSLPYRTKKTFENEFQNSPNSAHTPTLIKNSKLWRFDRKKLVGILPPFHCKHTRMKHRRRHKIRAFNFRHIYFGIFFSPLAGVDFSSLDNQLGGLLNVGHLNIHYVVLKYSRFSYTYILTLLHNNMWFNHSDCLHWR